MNKGHIQTEREAIYEGGSALGASYRLRVSEADEGGASLSITTTGASIYRYVSVEDLRAFGKQCMDAADEADALKAKADPEGEYIREQLKGNFKPVK